DALASLDGLAACLELAGDLAVDVEAFGDFAELAPHPPQLLLVDRGVAAPGVVALDRGQPGPGALEPVRLVGLVGAGCLEVALEPRVPVGHQLLDLRLGDHAL